MRGIENLPFWVGRCTLFSKKIVTLNIEANSLRFLVVRGKQILHWGSIPLEPGLVRDGFIADPPKVASAINTLFLERKLPKRRVIVSLTGLRSVARIFRLPKIKSKLLEEAIRNESEREMPVPLEELYLSWQPLGTTDSEQQFFVLGVPRNLVDTQVQTLAQAGIKPGVVNLKPLALARAVNREEALIIDLEPDNFDLVVVVDGIPVIMRTIISRGEGMTLEDRVRQLANELSQTVAFYNGSHPEHTLGPTTPTFLTGLLANDAAACELVKAAIDYPIEMLAPPFECPPDLPVAEYAVNIGLALGQTSPKASAKPGTVHFAVASLNVLPRVYRPRLAWSTSVLYPVVAVLLVVLLSFVYQMKTDTEAEIADIQAELGSVNQQLDQRVQAATRVDDTEADANSLKEQRQSILGTGSFADSLQLVLGALPSGVQLMSINQRENQTSLAGEADDMFSVIDYVAAMEQTGGFSTVDIASLSGGSNGSLATFSIVCIVGETGATE